MRSIRRSWCLVAAGLGAASCNSTPVQPTTPPAISVVGLVGYTRLGILALYQAQETMSDGTRQDVTSRVTWTSSAPYIIKIVGPALATSVAGNASAYVTATDPQNGTVGSLQVGMFFVGEDCVPYDPTALSAVQNGDAWNVTGGGQSFVALDNGADAANALALMERSTSLCDIGRSNTRSNHADYLAEYWHGSGESTMISPEDCQSYNPATLQVTSDGQAGWSLGDGSSQILLLDSSSDAMLAMSVAKQFSNHCFIGRNNTRADPPAFTVQYWK